jgi:twitching motility protein PilJ
MVVALSNMIPKLQLEYSALVEKMLSQDAPSKQVAAAIQQTVLAERILRNIDGVLQGGEESVLAANQFARNTNLFSIRLESMRSGNVALDMPAITDPKFNNNLAQITELFSYIKGSIEQVGVASNELVQVTQAGHGIYSGSQKLLDNATRLMKAYMIAAETRLIGEPTGYMLGATGILLFIWLSYRAHENAQAALVETRIQHRANREAIWRLLEELANLADGDLTVHATVGDEMTGAIAESVNLPSMP